MKSNEKLTKTNSINESSRIEKPRKSYQQEIQQQQEQKSTDQNRIKPKPTKVLSLNQIDFEKLDMDKAKSYKMIKVIDNHLAKAEDIDNDNDLSSINLSINNESDSLSEIFTNTRQKRAIDASLPLCKNINSIMKNSTFSTKTHFSPQSSVRIKVIDETDTDNCDN